MTTATAVPRSTRWSRPGWTCRVWSPAAGGPPGPRSSWSPRPVRTPSSWTPVPTATSTYVVSSPRCPTAGRVAPDVALLQSEVGAAVVDAAAAAAYERGIRVVVNNGPWLPLAAATLEAADPLVVNEHEAAEACDGSGAEAADLADAVRRRHGCRSVVSPAAPGERRSAERTRPIGLPRRQWIGWWTRRAPGTPSSGRSLRSWRRAAA